MQKRSTVLEGKIISIPALSLLSFALVDLRHSETVPHHQAGSERWGNAALEGERGPRSATATGKEKILHRDQRGATGQSLGGMEQTQPPPEPQQLLMASSPKNTAVFVSPQFWGLDNTGECWFFLVFFLLLPQENKNNQKNPQNTKAKKPNQNKTRNQENNTFFSNVFSVGEKMQLQFLTRTLISWKYLPLTTTKQRWKVLIF